MGAARVAGVAGVDLASSGHKTETSSGQDVLPSQAALTPAPTLALSPTLRLGQFSLNGSPHVHSSDV